MVMETCLLCIGTHKRCAIYQYKQKAGDLSFLVYIQVEMMVCTRNAHKYKYLECKQIHLSSKLSVFSLEHFKAKFWWIYSDMWGWK
jgi:hypothetical protein